MKAKKSHSGLLLICIIVLLAFIIIILLMSSISSISSARENAFRIEANNIVSSAEKVFKDYKNGAYKADNNSKSCQNDNKICITIDKLYDDKYYANDKYRGKVEIDITDIGNPMYTLYVTKNAEFRFVGLSYTNYTDYGQINNSPWLDEYETCNCEVNE